MNFLKNKIFLLALIFTSIYISTSLIYRGETIEFGDNISPFEFDETLGWAHKKHFSGTFTSKNFSVSIKTNNEGFRDSNFSDLGKKTRRRIVVLGDSMAWGWGVQIQDRFSDTIEDRLDDLAFLNLAVPGYGTDQSFLQLTTSRILDTNPDLVMLVFHPNDLSNNAHEEQYSYNKPFFTLKNNELKLENIPVPKSSLLQKVSRSIQKHFPGSRLSQFLLKFRHKQSRNFELSFHLIEAIRKKVESSSADFLLVILPMNINDQSRIVDFAKNKNISHLDLQATHFKPRDSYYFKNDDHWNIKGHQMAARLIEDYLSREIFPSKQEKY